MELLSYEREHLERLRRHLAECTVLLKSNGDFPLNQAGKLALYGSGARHTVKGGTGSGEVNSRFFVTVEQGLRDAGFAVTTDAWLDAYDAILADAHARFVKDIKARARKNHTMAIMEGMGAVMAEPEYDLPLDGEGDTAVYVLSRISGEGNDRSPVGGDILLSGTEIRDILALRERYDKFMLVLNVGGPVDLTPVLAVENILVLSQLGVETGAVLADILLGRENPSGKLATTWAAYGDYCAVGEFGDIDDTRYTEGIYVGYRWFDTADVKPLFPFGFGASFTTFAIGAPAVAVEGETVAVTVTVKNTGALSGKETVQLYVSVPAGALDQPMQTLAGFAKTGELAPGASEEVSVSFRLSELASFDNESAAYVLEAGDYLLRLGTSSRDTVIGGVIRLDERVIVRRVRHCGGVPDFTDWKPEHTAAAIPADAPIYPVAGADIPGRETVYEPTYEIDPVVEKLTDKELIYMSIGAFDPRSGLLSIVGNAAFSVAGAAGETTNLLRDKGIPAVVMADGPAGLRLAKDYAKDEKGVYTLGAAMPESVTEFMAPPLRGIIKLMNKKPGKNAFIGHQYATAIPIGTAIAQSWNTDFAELCGDIVGDEMERLGVHLWLAPALNIHRSIRCGRNFEYFSEDPLISGKFAAAITRGVQKHPGCGVTVKHYAANNQETNRYNNNSLVSERALREIYLRGFGICVGEAQPLAVMTSYNLLNGEHTSERRDILEDILRAEFGFQGVIMTDWVINGGTMNKKSVHPAPQAGKVAAAGGDLFMPGSQADYQSVQEALSAGRLTRRQLEINATRVCRLAKALTELRSRL